MSATRCKLVVPVTFHEQHNSDRVLDTSFQSGFHWFFPSATDRVSTSFLSKPYVFPHRLSTRPGPSCIFPLLLSRWRWSFVAELVLSLELCWSLRTQVHPYTNNQPTMQGKTELEGGERKTTRSSGNSNGFFQTPYVFPCGVTYQRGTISLSCHFFWEAAKAPCWQWMLLLGWCQSSFIQVDPYANN